MNDASDAQEDFRFGVEDKDAKAAAEAVAKIEALMQKTEAYWAAKKAGDAVALAKTSRTEAAQAAAAARGNDLAVAAAAFARMSAACNTCHELHLEKRIAR